MASRRATRRAGRTARLMGGQSQEAIRLALLSATGAVGGGGRGAAAGRGDNQRPVGHAAGVLLHARLLPAAERRRCGRGRVAEEGARRGRQGRPIPVPRRERSGAGRGRRRRRRTTAVARFLLGCLLYYRDSGRRRSRNGRRPWRRSPPIFRSRRALGLAYAEQGLPLEKAAAQLERAVELQAGARPAR